jgi:nucleotide-binding universal stress UspA family protein
MPTLDVLFAMTSYPAPTTNDAIGRVAGLSASLGAHVCGLTFELDIRSPVGLYADPVGVSGLFAAERTKSATNARDLIAAFNEAATRGGVAHEHAIEHCSPAEVTNILLAYARLRDLSIVPIKDNDMPPFLEELIFNSGRPVLLLPESTTRQLSSALETVVVAWDHSRPAARAVGDALPMLKAAKRVYVVTAVDEKHLGRPRSGIELCKHLARHGADVTFDELRVQGRAIGDALEAYVVERSADLLVMGAFGHSRVRDFVLGGATKSVLGRPFAWTLMSH